MQITNQGIRLAMLIAVFFAFLIGAANNARAEIVVLTCTATTTDDSRGGRIITGRYVTRINTDAGTYTTDGTDINSRGRAVVTDQFYILYYEYQAFGKAFRGHYQVDRYTGAWHNCFEGQSTCGHVLLGRSTCQREERRL